MPKDLRTYLDDLHELLPDEVISVDTVVNPAQYDCTAIIKKLEPTPQANYVQFQTLLDPNQMPEQRYDLLHWPYTEGLRLDEAMNELALLAVGVYGKVEQREDDSEATATKRLMVFEDITQPLAVYYKGEQIFEEVDASRGPDEVTASLCALIDAKTAKAGKA